LVEFLNGHFPWHRPSEESLIVVGFLFEHAPVLQRDLYATRHLVREALREARAGLNRDFAEKFLYIRAPNTLLFVLFRHNLTIQNRYGDHVGKTVISLFFGGNVGLVTFFPATNNVVSNIEGLHLHSLYVSSGKPVPPEQRENRFNCSLRMDLRVVLLH